MSIWKRIKESVKTTGLIAGTGPLLAIFALVGGVRGSGAAAAFGNFFGIAAGFLWMAMVAACVGVGFLLKVWLGLPLFAGILTAYLVGCLLIGIFFSGGKK